LNEHVVDDIADLEGEDQKSWKCSGGRVGEGRTPPSPPAIGHWDIFDCCPIKVLGGMTDIPHSYQISTRFEETIQRLTCEILLVRACSCERNHNANWCSDD